jgi:(p)ppGpp synthase/HD superfamily hydrolase
MDKIIINNEKSDLFRGLFEAIDFAAYKHRYQKRKGLRPVPYINHPIGVTKFLLDHIASPELEVLQSAILHDTLEDTKTTYEEIQQKFGDKVASIVNELTDDMSLSYRFRKRLQIENAKNLSFEAGCIKIADKYCNIYDVLNTYLGWPKMRKIQYIKWAIEVVVNIQNKNHELEKSFYEMIEFAGETLKTDFIRH